MIVLGLWKLGVVMSRPLFDEAMHGVNQYGLSFSLLLFSPGGVTDSTASMRELGSPQPTLGQKRDRLKQRLPGHQG